MNARHFTASAARAAGLGLVLVAVFALSGCGGRGDLSGSFTHQGKKVKYGTVTVFGGDGVPRYGEIDHDGSFTVKDIATGECRIAVSSPDPRLNPGLSPDDRREAVKNWFEIPPKCMHPDTSGVRYSLRSGSNQCEIELK